MVILHISQKYWQYAAEIMTLLLIGFISATLDMAFPTSIKLILLLRPLLTFPKMSAEVIFLVFLLYCGLMLEQGKVTA